MKKLPIIASFLILLSSTAAYANYNIAVSINGQPFNTPVYIDEENRSLIPVRDAANKLDFSVSWDENTNTAVLSNGSEKINLRQNENVIVCKNKNIKTKFKTLDNRLYVSTRSLADSIDLKTAWNDYTKTVYIMDPDKILYQNKDLACFIPKGYLKNDYSIELINNENYYSLNFLTAKNNQLLFSISVFDKDYWNNEVKDNFSIIYKKLYEDDIKTVICSNVSDVQYDPNNAEEKEIYEHLLGSKEQICNSMCFFTS